MAGLLDDSIQNQDVGMRGLADASEMNIRRNQANRAINAERVGSELHMAGQLIGTAIGSIWKEGGKGGALGMREGDTYAQMFTGKRPNSGSDMSSGQGSLLGSLFQYLNRKPADTGTSGDPATSDPLRTTSDMRPGTTFFPGNRGMQIYAGPTQ
jgi:hypothetical protein